MAIDMKTAHTAEDAPQSELPPFCTQQSCEGIWEATVGPTVYTTHTKQLLLSDIIPCISRPMLSGHSLPTGRICSLRTG